jgi:transcriptional regulator with PAS, ATPase and Fis domain
MPTFHKTLQRQMLKYLGQDFPMLKELEPFLKAISDAYVHFDEDRALIERSLELSSKELNDINRKLEEGYSLLRATLDSTADGLLVVDRYGKITIFNADFVKMWNIPYEVMSDKDDNKLLDFVLSQLKYPESFIKKVRELYEQPEAESFDVIEFKDGRIFERYSQPQRVGDKCVGRVWSFRDVTVQKNNEMQLTNRAVELEKINQFMMNRELKMAELKEENSQLKKKLGISQ